MPANFNRRQRLNPHTGFVEFPTGPMFPVVGEMLLRVDVWVMQKATGAIQMSYRDFVTDPPADPRFWVADDKYYPATWNGGRFERGPALGTAVLISLSPLSNTQSFYWWSEEVELVEHP
jgi:hypothetical protein